MPDAEKPRQCPNCGGTMRLIPTAPRAGGIPEVLTFECHVCKTVVTESASAPVQTE